MLFKVMLLDLWTEYRYRKKREVSNKTSGVPTFRDQVTKEKLGQQKELGQIT